MARELPGTTVTSRTRSPSQHRVHPRLVAASAAGATGHRRASTYLGGPASISATFGHSAPQPPAGVTMSMVGRQSRNSPSAPPSASESAPALADVEGPGQVERSRNIAGADEVADHIEVSRGRTEDHGVVAHQAVTRHDHLQVGRRQVPVDRMRRCPPWPTSARPRTSWPRTPREASPLRDHTRSRIPAHAPARPVHRHPCHEGARKAENDDSPPATPLRVRTAVPRRPVQSTPPKGACASPAERPAASIEVSSTTPRPANAARRARPSVEPAASRHRAAQQPRRGSQRPDIRLRSGEYSRRCCPSRKRSISRPI